MSTPFIGEIRLMSFNFPPRGWAQCDGATLAISGNQALFAILGTMYGGNGTSTFGLPDLRGRVPIHMGNGWNPGQNAGETAHTLTTLEIPLHVHTVQAATAAANQLAPANHLLATPLAPLYHAPDAGMVPLNPATIGTAGSSAPHDNLMPYLTVNFCIALTGIFPTRE